MKNYPQKGKIMRIAVLGGTGGVGTYFVKKALAAGHEINALVRTPSKLANLPNLTIHKGDVTNSDDINALVEGADLVVSCLGNVKGVLIMEKAANLVLAAAAKQNPMPKCLFVSSIGCGGSSWLIKQILQLINGRTQFADYLRADIRISKETVVPYVLVRPAALKEKPGNGKYRTFKGDGTFARPMAKEDVATFLLDAVTSDQWDNNGGIQLAGRK